MNIQFLPNGNMQMALTNEQKSVKNIGELQTSRSESLFIFLHLKPLGYNEIKPEDCGALTSAPLITDGKDVWGYMDYQVLSCLEELLAGKTITWQKG